MAKFYPGRITETEEITPIKLDVKDKKIISYLAEDSRMPLSKIAYEVKLSRDAVNYRIKRMVDQGLILGFVPLISLSKMGYNWYHVFLLLDDKDKRKQANLLESIKNHPNIRNVIEYSDRWDIEIVLIAKNTPEFDEILTEIISSAPEIVQEKTKMEVIKYYLSIHVPNVLCLGINKRVPKQITASYPLDEKDMKILEILSDDCRVSTYKIANKVNLSADSVGYRIKKMFNADYIEKFTVLLNLSKLNYGWFTFAIQINILDKQSEIKLKEFINNHPSIIRAVKTLGRWDLLLYIVTDSQISFHKAIKNIKSEFASIINSYQTWVAYREHSYQVFPDVIRQHMKKKKVMVFGSFDMLHPGHISLFREAKKHGTHLTVVVSRNKTLKEVKGSSPKYHEKDRLLHVKEIGIVDEAILGHKTDKYKVIREIKPDVICLGYDQAAFTDELEEKIKEMGLNPKIVRMKPYKAHKYKSSKLK